MNGKQMSYSALYNINSINTKGKNDENISLFKEFLHSNLVHGVVCSVQHEFVTFNKKSTQQRYASKMQLQYEMPQPNKSEEINAAFGISFNSTPIFQKEANFGQTDSNPLSTPAVNNIQTSMVIAEKERP